MRLKYPLISNKELIDLKFLFRIYVMNEFRPSRFELLPPVIKNLVIINVLVLIAQNTIGKQLPFSVDNVFALHSWKSSLFQPWQLITHLFMHGGLMHILGNMINLWFFGATLENLWGGKRFLIFYIICGLGAALLQLLFLNYEVAQLTKEYVDLVAMHANGAKGAAEAMLHYALKHGINLNDDFVNYLRSNPTDNEATGKLLEALESSFKQKLDTPTIGASGAVFGVMAGFAYLFPNDYIYLNFFIPIKVKWYVLGYFGIELFSSIKNSVGDNVAHWAHIGGAIVGLLLVITWNKTNRKTFY